MKYLKGKARLRRIIKNSVISNMSDDFVNFYSDGSWTLNCDDAPKNYVERRKLKDLGKSVYRNATDIAISWNFSDIEDNLANYSQPNKAAEAAEGGLI